MGRDLLIFCGLIASFFRISYCCNPPLPTFQQVPPAPVAPLLPTNPNIQASQFQMPPNSLVSGVQSGVASSNVAPAVSNSIDQELTPFSQPDSPSIQASKHAFSPYPGYIPPPPTFPGSTEVKAIPARENGLQNVAVDDNEVITSGCPQIASNVNQIISCLQLLPAIAMDEHALKCNFEQGTKCRFQPTSPAFQIAKLPSSSHYQTLAKLANRGEMNHPQGDFLALIERTGVSAETEFVFSTPIMCQNGTGILTFDFWIVGNPSAVLQVCTQDSKARSCTKEIIHDTQSSVTIQVIHPNTTVFDVDITVTNLTNPTVLIIDNLDYTAQLCDSHAHDEAIIEATPSADIVESFFEEGEQDEDSSASVPNRPLSDGPTPPVAFDEQLSEFIPSRDGPPAMSPFDLEIRQSPLIINKLNPCAQMTCNFNENFCGYKNWQNESKNTHDWQWSDGQVTRQGNPLTGIRSNPNNEGYLFVGIDHNEDNSIITYVLESPLLQINEDAELIFDLYRRSRDITLQVCLNSPNHCPLDVPAFKKETKWVEGLRFSIPQNTTRIYLKAIQWRKFNWLAIDNIRIVGPKECSTR